MGLLMCTATPKDTAEMLLQDAIRWAEKVYQERERTERAIKEGQIEPTRQAMWKHVPEAIWEALDVRAILAVQPEDMDWVLETWKG